MVAEGTRGVKSLPSGYTAAMRKLWPLALIFVLTSCTATPTPPITPPTPSPTATPNTSPALTPTPSLEPRPLHIWLPPNFAPDQSAVGGEELAAQLAAFETNHPGERVEVRLKQASGPGGLLHSLLTAHNVAPEVLPNVIALSRDDLATAATAGLVTPLDDFFPAETLEDYYPFAREMSQAEGLFVGLPFAADARVVAYNTQLYATPPLTWSAVLTGPFVLPGGEPAAITVLNEYLALGGSLADSTGRLALDSQVLANTLTLFQEAQSDGIIPLSTLAYTEPAATWQVFRERRAALAATSMQWYLVEWDRASTAAITLIPVQEGASFALADGWVWALVNTAPEQQARAAELVAWLTAPAQLGKWTQAARVLPPRSSAFALWSSTQTAAYVGEVLAHTQLQPSAAVLARVGPPLRQALDDVLSGRATPFAAANIAAQAVEQP